MKIFDYNSGDREDSGIGISVLLTPLTFLTVLQTSTNA
jgi:hypothetical protein